MKTKTIQAAAETHFASPIELVRLLLNYHQVTEQFRTVVTATLDAGVIKAKLELKNASGSLVLATADLPTA